MEAFNAPRAEIASRDSNLGEWWDELLHKRDLRPQWTGARQIQSCCPAHHDTNPSMSSKITDSKILVNCFAGCSIEDICCKLGVRQSDLFARNGHGPRQEPSEIESRPVKDDEPPESPLPAEEEELRQAQQRFHGSDTEKRLNEARCWTLLATAAYELGLGNDGRVLIPFRDSAGRLLSVERYNSESADGRTKTLVSRGQKRHLLLPPGGIKDAEEIFLTEGASDAIAMYSRGVSAVVAVPSASVWKEEYADTIEGASVKRVYIVFDCDDPGRKHADRVGRSLAARGISVFVVDLDPARGDGHDLTDFLLENRGKLAAEIWNELKQLATPHVAESHPQRDSDAKFQLVAPSLDEVEPIRWAWRDWLVAGAFNLLVGEEESGKSTLSAHVLSKLTRGELDGDLAGEPCMVLILGDEDDFNRTWTPKLLVAGADLDLIRLVRGKDGEALSFPSGADTLRGFVEETRAQVVFFDQFSDHLDVVVDDWRSKDVRRAVRPVHALASELQFTVIATLHTNKARGGSFRQSVSGTHAFNALSRSSLLVAKHPDGPEERRVVARGKGNYGRRPVSQEFTIVGKSPKIGAHCIQTSLATGFKDSDLMADDLLASRKPEPTSKIGRAREYIKSVLADHESHDAGPIIEYLTDNLGIGERQIRQAREDIGAKSEPEPKFQGGASWRLPRPHEIFSRISRDGRNGESPDPTP